MLLRFVLGPLLFLMFFTVYGIYAWEIPLLPFEQYEAVDSSTLPKIYAGLGVIFSFLGVIAQFIKYRDEGDDPPPLGLKKENVLTIAQVIVLMVIYSALLEPLGFIVSTLLFLIAGFWVMGERRGRILLLSSVPMVVIFWLIMTQLLDIYLAAGTFWS